MVGLAPRGFVFFGNAISICEEIEKNVVQLLESLDSTSPAGLGITSPLPHNMPRTPSLASLTNEEQASEASLRAVRLPVFCIVDFRDVPSIDSTAARWVTTLLQL